MTQEPHSLQLEDYKDYIQMQERWRAEIAELLTTVCPSVGIRRNHTAAPDLYVIHQGEHDGFAILNTLIFSRFLKSVNQEFADIEALFSAWLKYLAVEIVQSI